MEKGKPDSAALRDDRDTAGVGAHWAQPPFDIGDCWTEGCREIQSGVEKPFRIRPDEGDSVTLGNSCEFLLPVESLITLFLRKSRADDNRRPDTPFTASFKC